jgi:hypothetical protein
MNHTITPCVAPLAAFTTANSRLFTVSSNVLFNTAILDGHNLAVVVRRLMLQYSLHYDLWCEYTYIEEEDDLVAQLVTPTLDWLNTTQGAGWVYDDTPYNYTDPGNQLPDGTLCCFVMCDTVDKRVFLVKSDAYLPAL